MALGRLGGDETVDAAPDPLYRPRRHEAAKLLVGDASTLELSRAEDRPNARPPEAIDGQDAGLGSFRKGRHNRYQCRHSIAIPNHLSTENVGRS